MKGVTEPPEWRRRAALAAASAGTDDPAWDTGSPLRTSAVEGLAALDAGEAAQEQAIAIRQIVWSQPEDVPGIVIGFEPVAIVAAHAAGQDFGAPGLAVAFLARHFAESGDDGSLEAAIELHDLCVALGDDLWETAECGPLGWGAAELYALTGEDAFLATAERAADVLCEAQDPTGAIAAGRVATARAAFLLAAMAEAVEARQSAGIDEHDEAEDGAGGGPDA